MKRKGDQKQGNNEDPPLKRACDGSLADQHVLNLQQDLSRQETCPEFLRRARASAHTRPEEFLTTQGVLVACAVLADRMRTGHITRTWLEDVKRMLRIYRRTLLAQESGHDDSISVLLGSLEEVDTWLGLSICSFVQMPVDTREHYQLAAGLSDGIDVELRKRLSASCSCGPLSETQVGYYAAIMVILKEVCGAWNGTGEWANLEPCVLLQALWGMSSRAGVMPTEKEVMEFVHLQFMPHEERKDYMVCHANRPFATHTHRDALYLTRGDVRVALSCVF